MALTQFGSDSEYGQLKAVLLYIPGSGIAGHPDPRAVQHLAPVNSRTLSAQLRRLIATLTARGIQVQIIARPTDPADCSNFNMMFCRDLLFMTPLGAIMANMANETRRPEVAHAAARLNHAGIPILHSVSGAGRFEGADALWITKRLVVVGLGNRTNNDAFNQIKGVLARQGIEAVPLPSTQQTTQHLLGSLQIVAADLAFVREQLIAPEAVCFLERQGFTVVRVPENPEVRHRQAMNIVTLAPRQIMMTADCPETKELYQRAGVEVTAELTISELICAAGGLACTTGILARKSV